MDPSMPGLRIECLRCGAPRTVEPEPRLRTDECLRCRYVGWAFSSELDERIRRLLRERPVERRRLRAA
jgi:hypothetical protein